MPLRHVTTWQMNATADKSHEVDRATCQEIKVDLVFALRTVLRTLTDANQSPEANRAAQEVEKALNKALVP